MNREVPYYLEEICDGCGNEGAYDFMGDLLCDYCVDEYEDECEHLHVEDNGAGNEPRLECLDCGRGGYIVFEGEDDGV